MNYELMKDLVDNLERFEQENITKKGTLKDFSLWLFEQQNAENRAFTDVTQTPNELDYNTESSPRMIGQLLTYLSRYLKIYFKKALVGTELTTSDDFTYLATLFHNTSLTKTELILMNKHEKTSGMEVIKRLLSSGFIQQFDDENDKRSKRVSLTQEGQKVLFHSFENMQKVANISTGNLSETENNQLLNLLKRLDNFHNDIFMNHRNMDLDQILEKK